MNVYVGSVPYSICQLTSLTALPINYGGSNPGIPCAPLCVSSVSLQYLPSTICVYPQDTGLCGLIAATSIQSISGYSQWSCTTGGATSTVPCLSPVWPGVTCSGMNVVSINIASIGLTG